MNKAALILIQVLCLAVFVSAGTGLSDIKFTKMSLYHLEGHMYNENHDIAIAMSPSRADPVLPWLGIFKCLIQCYCTVWGYLNI